MRAWLERVLNFFFPPSRTEVYLCGLPAQHWRQEFPAARALPVDWAEALLSYGDKRVRALVWLIKYKQRAVLIERAGQLLLETFLAGEQERLSLAGMGEVGTRERWLLVPIPMSKERLRDRGGNHTEKIAQAMLSAGGAGFLELAPDVLVKTRHTQTQTSLPRAARLQNVTGSFKVLNPTLVAGKNILLLDDVVTTGATLGEARRVLLEAGARELIALTLAH